jgi:hypothetical protein
VDVEDNTAAHNVACSAKHLGEAGNNDIGVGQYIDVDEGADGLVADDGEMVLIGKRADGTSQKKLAIRWPAWSNDSSWSSSSDVPCE